MTEKLHRLIDQCAHLEHQLAAPEILSDPARYAAAVKEWNAVAPLAEKVRALEKLEEQLADAEELLRNESEPELRALAEEEIRTLREEFEQQKEALRQMMTPRDPDDERNVIVEIRAGTGGEEAALFAGELYRMYTMYASVRGFTCELMDVNETELGGLKKVIFLVSGSGAYARFRFESGVHRVQRVPETESNGKLQTSAATVAVLPEAGEIQIEIRPDDVRIETMKSTGAGGQHINKTLSAIRLTHLPTGIVIECQDERSQLRNKEKAMRLLRARLYDLERTQQRERIDGTRRAQVGSGDRSERIRTYNFREGRVTDHRIGLTLYTLPAFLNGDMDALIDALTAAAAEDKLDKED